MIKRGKTVNKIQAAVTECPILTPVTLTAASCAAQEFVCLFSQPLLEAEKLPSLHTGSN